MILQRFLIGEMPAFWMTTGLANGVKPKRVYWPSLLSIQIAGYFAIQMQRSKRSREPNVCYSLLIFGDRAVKALPV